MLEKHFFVTPPAEYRKPGVVWKIKRYLYGDKRAPRGWQDHFKNDAGIGLRTLGVRTRLLREGSQKDTIIVVVRVDDLLSNISTTSLYNWRKR